MAVSRPCGRQVALRRRRLCLLCDEYFAVVGEDLPEVLGRPAMGAHALGGRLLLHLVETLLAVAEMPAPQSDLTRRLHARTAVGELVISFELPLHLLHGLVHHGAAPGCSGQRPVHLGLQGGAPLTQQTHLLLCRMRHVVHRLVSVFGCDFCGVFGSHDFGVGGDQPGALLLELLVQTRQLFVHVALFLVPVPLGRLPPLSATVALLTQRVEFVLQGSYGGLFFGQVLGQGLARLIRLLYARLV
mmetsp:Transcript_18703/g.45009  ORF Transcript_18703/g.45009 Transcript_18703/m.45009 type:complete len:244 (-) Transcript_18703:558-1289(-)